MFDIVYFLHIFILFYSCSILNFNFNLFIALQILFLFHFTFFIRVGFNYSLYDDCALLCP